MGSYIPPEISRHDLGPFEPNSLLPEGQTLSIQARGGLKQFLRNAIDSAGGPILTQSANTLIQKIATYEENYHLFSAAPFRYVPPAEQPEVGLTCTAESTVRGAISNM